MSSAAAARKFAPRAPRLAAFYTASFLVIGIQQPFWPVWLTGRGLDVHQIALVFAAGIWAKVLATPAIGATADRLGRGRAIMVVLAATATLAYAGLAPVTGFWPILLLCLVGGVAQSGLLPLGDSVTLAAVRDEGADYGRIRVWGSVSFIVGAAGAGLVLGAAAGLPDAAILGLVVAASGLLVVACLAMPQARKAEARRQSRWAAIGRLARNRRFWLLVASAAALQASHQVYYGFGTLYWRSLGFSDAAIGALWAEGVVAEIVLFWCSAPIVHRVGPIGLLIAGGCAGIIRWSLTGLIPSLGGAAVLQLLHAGTFGASHLGAMHFMARTVPPDAAASAQALYAGASAGLGSGLVMLIAGTLYGAYGGKAYLAMALLSALGLVCAGLLNRATDR